MESIIVSIIIAIGIAIFFMAISGKPWIKKTLDFLQWVVGIIRTSFDYWKLDKKYSKAATLSLNLLSLGAVLSSNKEPTDIRDLRKYVAEVVKEVHEAFYPDRPWDEETQRLTVAAYVAVLSIKELKLVIISIFEGHENLDVKRATLIAVDVLGELLVLEDKLGQEHFKHIIYGLNQSLILIRDGGTDKKVLKEVASTLFRVYKITTAYRKLRGLKTMTDTEFYEKVINVFGAMRSIYVS